MAYKLLGFAVWQGAKWYLRRRYGSLVPSKPVLAAALLAVGLAGAAVAAKAGDEG